ncbi:MULTISPECIES: TetR/AcrR family transcriptional regulator [unclassified Burkholderia]|uniref:TetR/AcrR family transcriptional regulator n=1 Tax=unclassified Burkholderia TaxID=2613784 RepID=UPI000F5866CA|nr:MULTISPECIES: TetR/AcrR family transcriptional regulator C-terminal domain-containing protein [unclassified Burkholderia]RQR27779.1 TetR/AcrR family transcriptional regulator [Burkholderia sp. Bp9143]RQR30742.1 TetR/AcrR family transcriptional regulator [Burkholderia sp. Bp9142]RQR45962.1 TetR/AcrR family transcriptional regulator [Burkholderia sp. Bp9140]RQZ21039.1 TetR/AcrR family transcriptional regulator [Burkholderia sp. Bp9031]
MTDAPRNKTESAGETVPRRRGRPPKTASAIGTEPLLSRKVIIERASEMARSMPLDQVSMVQLSKEFGVAPGLIHYYLGSRDDLISGVLNGYYRQRLEALPALTGDWRPDVEKIARISYAFAREMPGVSLYIASHNRFRLFQAVGPGETDYGLALFNHTTSAFLQGGFTAEKTALAYHLLAQYLLSSSVAAAGRQSPAEHSDYIRDKFEAASDDRYPAAKLVGSAFSKLSADCAFDEGLRLLLDGFEQWPRSHGEALESSLPRTSRRKRVANNN